MTQTSATPKKKKKEYLLNHLRKAWQHRRTLLKAGCAGLVAGVVIALSLPDEYECSIFTVPEKTIVNSMTEDMLDEASAETTIAGKKIRDAILPSMYPQVIGSAGFLTSLFDIPVQPAFCHADSTITLYEYLEKHQKHVWWTWVTGKIRGMISFLMDPTTKTPDIKSSFQPGAPAQGPAKELMMLSPKDAGIAGALNSRISVGVDRDKRTITLTVRMQDARVASTVADSLKNRLRKYITRYRTQKELDQLVYARKLHDEAREAYFNAQEEHARYADSHRDLVSKIAQGKLQDLKIKKDMAYKEYMRTNQLVIDAETRVNKIRPVFIVVEPAVTPLQPSSPSVVRIMAICFLLGIGAGYGLVWLKEKKEMFSRRYRVSAKYQPTD